MKRGVALFLLGICCNLVFSQDQRELLPATDQPTPEVNGLVKTNPLAAIWGAIPFTSEIRLIGEMPLANRQSTFVGFSLMIKSPILAALEDSSNRSSYDLPFVVSGLRLQLGHRFYVNHWAEALGIGTDKAAPAGWYFMPHLSYSTARFSDRYWNRYDVYVRITHFNVNLLMGYQLLNNDRIAFDFFWGMGYKNNYWSERNFRGQTVPIDPDLGGFYSNNLSIQIGFSIGTALDQW